MKHLFILSILTSLFFSCKHEHSDGEEGHTHPHTAQESQTPNAENAHAGHNHVGHNHDGRFSD